MTCREVAHLSCAAAARIVAARAGIPEPHRDTLKGWAVRWCSPMVHYVATPGRFRLRPCAVEKILSNLTEPR